MMYVIKVSVSASISRRYWVTSNFQPAISSWLFLHKNKMIRVCHIVTLTPCPHLIVAVILLHNFQTYFSDQHFCIFAKLPSNYSYKTLLTLSKHWLNNGSVVSDQDTWYFTMSLDINAWRFISIIRTDTRSISYFMCKFCISFPIYCERVCAVCASVQKSHT